MKNQRNTDREDAVPGDADPRTETRRQLPDLRQAGQAVGRLHPGVLGVVGQPVQHCDLIQPDRGCGRRQLERRRLVTAQRDEE
jgi:hypothetical protein